jgi:hypothetical protein
MDPVKAGNLMASRVKCNLSKKALRQGLSGATLSSITEIFKSSKALEIFSHL